MMKLNVLSVALECFPIKKSFLASSEKQTGKKFFRCFSAEALEGTKWNKIVHFTELMLGVDDEFSSRNDEPKMYLLHVTHHDEEIQPVEAHIEQNDREK